MMLVYLVLSSLFNQITEISISGENHDSLKFQRFFV